MTLQPFDESFGKNAPENYERYFVPAIGEPVARDLLNRAELQPGERVLDVACGTGIVTRLASEQVGDSGSVTGLDVNPGMLAVAREVTPSGLTVEWIEAPAESIPLPDASFDVVLCQMGLQFMEDRAAALNEMYRVLAPGGRLLVNVPGPAGKVFALFAEALGRQAGPEAAGFVSHVFTLHETREIRQLLENAGFRDAEITEKDKELSLPPPEKFLWQYISSTPLAGLMSGQDGELSEALEEDLLPKWASFAEGDVFRYEQRVVTAKGLK